MPKLKAFPTPAQAKYLTALHENLGLRIIWYSRRTYGRGAQWTGVRSYETKLKLGNPRLQVLHVLNRNKWIEIDGEHEEFLNYWKISDEGRAVLAGVDAEYLVTKPKIEMPTGQILASVKTWFPSPAWLWVEELTVSKSTRRVDAFALRLIGRGRENWLYHPVNGLNEKYLATWAIEVKATRADFLDELKNPEKRAPGMAMVNRFAFAAPAGMIDVDKELPEDCGLFSVDSPKVSRLARMPEWSTGTPPDWLLVAGIARALLRGNYGEANIR